MNLYQHNSYQEYRKFQRNLTARKTKNGKVLRTWITPQQIIEVNNLILKYTDRVKRMVCHGCRSGVEVDMFQRLHPGAEVWGTDLYGEAFFYDRKFFREMDFDTVPAEWIGYFDLIYCNCIDHSRNPINTLQQWRSELRLGGLIFVNFEWGQPISKEDCFHLDSGIPRSETILLAHQANLGFVYGGNTKVDEFGNSYADTILRRDSL